MSRFSHYEGCPRCQEIGRDGRSDNLGVYSDGSAHCFACSYHKFPNAWFTKTIEEKHDTTVLPSTFTREVPQHAWRWLLQFGLGYKYWQPFVGWSEKDSRLVFTVGNPTEFSVGRFLPREPRDDKRKWFVWGDCHKTPHVIGDYQQSNVVVLVEDVISAHKVAAITSCIPLFGTNIFSAVIPVLRHIGLPIVIWLDNDQSHTMNKKAYNLYLLTGLSVSYISTELDPKMLPLDTIKGLLK